PLVPRRKVGIRKLGLIKLAYLFSGISCFELCRYRMHTSDVNIGGIVLLQGSPGIDFHPEILGDFIRIAGALHRTEWAFHAHIAVFFGDTRVMRNAPTDKRCRSCSKDAEGNKDCNDDQNDLDGIASLRLGRRRWSWGGYWDRRRACAGGLRRSALGTKF